MDLYEAGIGVKIEEMIREMLAGPGAVRRTLHGWLFS
jgi:fructuronate reductase